MKLIVHWVVSALAILIAAYLLPGVTISGITAALILAVVLGAINAVLKPILVLLTLPVSVVTLGLFVLVIDAVLILLATNVVSGFAVSGFLPALLFAVVLAVVSSVLHSFEKSGEGA